MRRRKRSDEATAASRSRRRRLAPGSSGLAARSSWRRRASSAVRSAAVVSVGMVVFGIGVASKLIEGRHCALEESMRQPVRSWYSRRAGITGLVLAAWSSSACTHWKVQSAFPEQVVSRRPQKVRVTRNDSSRIVLRRPEIVGRHAIRRPARRTGGRGEPAARGRADRRERGRCTEGESSCVPRRSPSERSLWRLLPRSVTCIPCAPTEPA